MSCPPPSFLTLEVLKDMAAALKPQGLLAMNCVSRSEAAFKEAVAAVQVLPAQPDGPTDVLWQVVL